MGREKKTHIPAYLLRSASNSTEGPTCMCPPWLIKPGTSKLQILVDWSGWTMGTIISRIWTFCLKKCLDLPWSWIFKTLRILAPGYLGLISLVPFQKRKETSFPEWSSISEEFKSMEGWNHLCSLGFTFFIGETPDTGGSGVEFVLSLRNIWVSTIIYEVIEIISIICMGLVLVMDISHFSWGKSEWRLVCLGTSQLTSLEAEAAGAVLAWRLDQFNGHHFCRYGRAIGSPVKSNIQSKDDALGSSCLVLACFSWYLLL